MRLPEDQFIFRDAGFSKGERQINAREENRYR
jgi:hypothetical protein